MQIRQSRCVGAVAGPTQVPMESQARGTTGAALEPASRKLLILGRGGKPMSDLVFILWWIFVAFCLRVSYGVGWKLRNNAVAGSESAD